MKALQGLDFLIEPADTSFLLRLLTYSTVTSASALLVRYMTELYNNAPGLRRSIFIFIFYNPFNLPFRSSIMLIGASTSYSFCSSSGGQSSSRFKKPAEIVAVSLMLLSFTCMAIDILSFITPFVP